MVRLVVLYEVGIRYPIAMSVPAGSASCDRNVERQPH